MFLIPISFNIKISLRDKDFSLTYMQKANKRDLKHVSQTSLNLQTNLVNKIFSLTYMQVTGETYVRLTQHA